MIKPPALVFTRDDRHPDDRAGAARCCCRSTTATRSGSPERRPIATTAGIATIAAMAYLTYLGAHAGRARQDRPEGRPPQLEAGQGGRAPVGLPGAATSSARPATRLGPEPDRDRRRGSASDAIARTLRNPTAPMPSFRTCRQAREVQRARRVRRLAQGRSQVAVSGGAPRIGHAARDAGAVDVRPHRGRLRPR